jgi:hypothetical protein
MLSGIQPARKLTGLRYRKTKLGHYQEKRRQALDASLRAIENVSSWKSYKVEVIAR